MTVSQVKIAVLTQKGQIISVSSLHRGITLLSTVEGRLIVSEQTKKDQLTIVRQGRELKMFLGQETLPVFRAEKVYVELYARSQMGRTFYHHTLGDALNFFHSAQGYRLTVNDTGNENTSLTLRRHPNNIGIELSLS